MKRKIRLFVDSHLFVAAACQQLLEPTFEVISIVTESRALVHPAPGLNPDGIVLEVSLPLSGLDSGEQLIHKLPALKLVFLTASADEHTAAEAFRRKANACPLKHSGSDEFLTVIRSVIRWESYTSPGIARETIDYPLHAQP